LDNAEILELMRRLYGVVAGGGLEETAGKVIRLAHMSMTSREIYVTHSILALGLALKALGRGVDPSLGVDAVKKVFADHPSERS
jgi:pyridoxamine--pyruvate transaminase